LCFRVWAVGAPAALYFFQRSVRFFPLEASTVSGL
jgi:hypothetical protein